DGAFGFVIANGGNVTTPEQVTVTESSIFGTGLFGNNGVHVHYTASNPVILTGQLANDYIVAPSHPGARFNNPVLIDDEFSAAPLSVTVVVDSGSSLHLGLFDQHPASASLFISAAPGGTFNPSKPVTPNGSETVTFPGGLTSEVLWEGFGS